MTLPTVLQITLTYNRHTLTERVIKCFLEQDYEGMHILFLYNTGKETVLADIDLPSNKNIILVNNNTDFITKTPYTSVGAKYRDAFSFAPLADIVNHLDSDDLCLPSHITEGVKGFQKAQKEHKSAYKPQQSYFYYNGVMTKEENVFEGSIFIDYKHVKAYKYLDNSVKYHDGWLEPLLKQNLILVDSKGTSTFVYDWFNPVPTYKMSGLADTQQNFDNSQLLEKDFGDGVLTPAEEINISLFKNS